MDIKTLHCINFIETLKELQANEWHELGLDVPTRGDCKILPDGREDIYHRLWEELSERQWGNQEFSNDSFYRVPAELNDDGTLYADNMSDDKRKLFEHCFRAWNADGSGNLIFLLFDVCW